jgi:hypothetical protein
LSEYRYTFTSPAPLPDFKNGKGLGEGDNVRTSASLLLEYTNGKEDIEIIFGLFFNFVIFLFSPRRGMRVGKGRPLPYENRFI